jgi:hypothetical protein
LNKNYLYIFFLLLSWAGQAQQLTLNGVYRGRNLYIQNPFNNKNKSFCVQSVSINGKTVISSPNSSALTVNLSRFSLNDSLSLIIFHYADCKPKILNPRVVESGDGFSIIQPAADNASVSWITTGEQDKKAYFELEKMFLDGWNTIEKIEAKGDIDNNQYSIGAVHYAGSNEFRIHYISNSMSVYSENFEFYSASDPISFYPIDEVDEIISLSKETDYEIKNFEGRVVKKGKALDIFVEDLKPGEYILIIENREEVFFKPEPEIDLPPVRKRKKK